MKEPAVSSQQPASAPPRLCGELPAVARVVFKNGRSASGPLAAVNFYGIEMLRIGHERSGVLMLPGLIAEVWPLEGRIRSLSELAAVTADVFGVPLEQMLSKSSVREITEARFAFWTVARSHGIGSLKDLALAVGKKDHGTVMHGLSVARDLMDTDETFAVRVKKIEVMLALAAGVNTTPEAVHE